MNYKKLVSSAIQKYGAENVKFVPINELDTNNRGMILDSNNVYDYIHIGVIRILFPEITIQNEDDDSHVISNLVVNISIVGKTGHRNCYGDEVTNLRLRLISGARFSYDSDEIVAGYNHSHLSNCSADFNDGYKTERIYTSFCLGGDHAYTSLWDVSISDDFQFTVYLSELEAYLAWESFEGSPYKYMSSVGSTKQLKPLSDEFETEDIIPYLLQLHVNKGIELVIDDNLNLKPIISNIPVAETINTYFKELIDWNAGSKVDTCQVLILCIKGEYYLINDTDGAYTPFVPEPISEQISLFQDEESERVDWATVKHPIDESKEMFYINHPKKNNYEPITVETIAFHPDIQRLWMEYRSRVESNQRRKKQITAYRNERNTHPECQSIGVSDDPLFAY